MPQPAAATQPQDEAQLETLKTEKAANEAAPNPEKAELENAVKSGNVYQLFKGKALEAVLARKKLATVEPSDKSLAPATVEKIEKATGVAEGKIHTAESDAVAKVDAAMGKKTVMMGTVEDAPAPTPVVEVKKAPEENPELKKLEAALEEAAKEMEQAHKAMLDFGEEHGFDVDPKSLVVPEMDMAKLTKTERLYVLVLQSGAAAGRMTMEHLQAQLDAFNEKDPAMKEARMKSVKVLEERAKEMKKEAATFNAKYMALPEIAALIPSVIIADDIMDTKDSTGGSVGGQAFDQATGEPPTEQKPTRSGGGGGLYNEDVHSGGNPMPKLTLPEGSKGEKVEPTAVDNWFSRNWKALGGFFGRGDSSGGGDRH